MSCKASKKIKGWGWVGIHGSTKGISQISFGKSSMKKWSNPSIKKALAQIEKYLKGHSKSFSLKINPKGTLFQKRVWKTLQKIPYGETRSYQWVAKKIGKPKAARAVGQACKVNPLPLIIPCHRVVASHGKIGGFSAGLTKKHCLLRLEKIWLR